MSIVPAPHSVNIGGSRPSAPPTPCPTCTGERIWWPNATGDAFIAACPWCSPAQFTTDPDDDSDLDTLPEPTPLATPDLGEGEGA